MGAAATGYRHEALFHRGGGDLLARTLPFLREGIARDDAVLVVLPKAKVDALQHALGGDAGAIEFADEDTVGENPARIIPRWQEWAQRHAGRPLRGIGEPIGPRRVGAELIECHRHESLLNVAFDMDTPFRLLCPYDVDALPDDVLAEARRTHPLVDGRPSHDYVPFDAAEPFSVALDAAPVGAAVFGFDRRSLDDLRSFVRDETTASGLGAGRIDDLVLSVNEIATNSVLHGGGSGDLRLWSDKGSVVCEVRDQGLIHQPMIGRLVPPGDHESGRGHWIANQLCDLVQVHSSRRGTAVRLHMRRR